MILCLNVFTWIGLAPNALHWYGSLFKYEGDDGEPISVMRRIRPQEAANINREEGHIVYRTGDECRFFDTEEAVVEQAKRKAVEMYGSDVQLYRGRRAHALEDMERLL